MTEARVTYRGVVYPWQCDSMGHFTTRFYMAVFDEAAWHFLWEVGFDPATVTERNIGWADVRHEIEYLAEMRAGDLFYITARPLRIGNKSIVCQLEIRAVSDDAARARLTATTVQFDLERRCAVPVLPEVRERLLAWLG